MKKYLLFALLILMMFPFVVEAKEYCVITKGTGRNVGDEITCGTEEFYVISVSENKNPNEPDMVSLLAKYNLFVGDKIDYADVDPADVAAYGDSTLFYCDHFGEVSTEYNPYHTEAIYENGQLKGCRLYEKIEYEHIRQDSRAVGTTLVNGKSVLPLYGIVYMNPYWGYEYYHDHINYEYSYDANGNIVLSTTPFEKYINGYKAELESQGIDVRNVSFITLSGVLNLLKKVSGQNVIVELTYPDDPNHPGSEFYYGKMDIRNYLGEDYKWLYSVTYWLGSGFLGDPDNTPQDLHNDYYISNEGMLCAIGRGECKYLPYPIGNGIRPVIVVPLDGIKYAIRTKTDGNGTIEVVDSAYGNESITFKITANKGYKLSKLIVTTDSNETIEFAEGSIVNNPDGTVSINNNSFTMPFENVTIEAVWVSSISIPDTLKNINTGIFIMGILFILLGIGVYLFKKKESIM